MVVLNKRIKKVLINEKTNEVLIIIVKDPDPGQERKILAERIRAMFKRNKDFKIRIVESAEGYSLKELFDEYKTFFCNTWAKTFPAGRLWFDSCTCSINCDLLRVEFDDHLAVKALSGRGFEGFTQNLIYALSGKNVAVLAGVKNNVNGECSKNYRTDIENEELLEIKKIIKCSKRIKDKIIIGKPFKGAPKPINEIIQDMGTVIVEGDICRKTIKEFKRERYSLLLSLFVTDYEDTIECRFFLKDSDRGKAEALIQTGDRVRIKGEVQYNKYVRDIVVNGRDIISVPKKLRTDTDKEKRIELHAHTRFSALDGVSAVDALIEKAAQWGHNAIAITDHGVVQAFPEAFDASQRTGIKIIYGMEGYLIDDEYLTQQAAFDWERHNHFVVFDIETTGLSPAKNEITEIGAVRVKDGVITDKFGSLINPGVPIPKEITELTGITDDMVKDSPPFEQVIHTFLDFVGDGVLTAHNAPFDLGFIQAKAAKLGINISNEAVDTLTIVRRLFPRLKSHKLSAIAAHLKINAGRAHRARDDAITTARVLIKCMDRINKDRTFKSPISPGSPIFKEMLRKLRSFHVTILAKNQEGLRALYHMVSKSHLYYFYKTPKIPKSLLAESRDGLLIGSACEAGELYRGIIEGKSDYDLEKLASFYDFLEIQPIANNYFLIDNGILKDIDEIKNINRKICELGKKIGIPVVATGDTHFIDPVDQVYRKIILAGKGMQESDLQTPLFLRTTSEMLTEFQYLGKETAKEIVIDNPNSISNNIENGLLPIPLKTFPPTIPGAEEALERMAWEQANKAYGSLLPVIVEERLKKELSAIIDNGYAVMFYTAAKLVSKSNKDGYLVGSRGSVGSSLVATLCGITEVNPLPPHYLCKKCRYSYFVTEEDVGAGADMKDKMCPECGIPLSKHGFDIPFEVFMGFKGDKEPDIDLNFSGAYQSQAHRFAEELFGEKKVYRAGTISTLADRTAYGFVKGYLDERGLIVHNAEINRLIQGCAGIKRTTGQHPGGIMIVPKDMDIHQFTPVQRPADDPNAEVITTHFDYRALSGRLLKLDILGHDDPTMLKMLHRLTGKDPRDITPGDKDTMDIFSTTKPLGVTPEDINCPVGTIGIPEFGTWFVRQMLKDTKPTTMSELVRISGLSHGTDVWINNAQNLIQNKTATLKEVISTRDDIFMFLIKKGMPPQKAFSVMERVRRGMGVTEEDAKEMLRTGCPEWFIESCKKIKYMFPKAHAAAYVSMAFKIAYYKVHYPLAFYAAYFTIRANEFDAQLIVTGKEAVTKAIKGYETRKNDLTQKEKALLIILEAALEMYCRDFKFMPVDIYKSHSSDFQISDNKLLPPLMALQGLGENAAKNITKARENGPFISIENLQERTRINRAVIDILKEHGCLSSLPESNQISLF